MRMDDFEQQPLPTRNLPKILSKEAKPRTVRSTLCAFALQGWQGRDLNIGPWTDAALAFSGACPDAVGATPL